MAASSRPSMTCAMLCAPSSPTTMRSGWSRRTGIAAQLTCVPPGRRRPSSAPHNATYCPDSRVRYIELHPANTDDRAGILPTLPRLAALGFQGDLLGDRGCKGAPFAAAALAHDIHVSVSPGGTRDGRFLPNGIRWVVERLFAWLSRYRRSEEHTSELQSRQ